jgi:hypothetical protein
MKKIFSDGSTFEGTLKDGEYHGHVIFTFFNGTKLKSEFRNGRRQGTGTLIYPDGSEKEIKDGEIVFGIH